MITRHILVSVLSRLKNLARQMHLNMDENLQSFLDIFLIAKPRIYILDEFQILNFEHIIRIQHIIYIQYTNTKVYRTRTLKKNNSKYLIQFQENTIFFTIINKCRHKQTRRRQDIDQTLTRHRADIDQTQTRHRQDIDKTQTRHRQDIDKTQTRHRQDIDKTQTRHRQDIDKTQTRHRQDIDKTQTRHRPL